MLHIDSLNNYTYKTPRLYALNRTTRRPFVRVHTKARAIIIRRLNNRYQYFAVIVGYAWLSSTCISASQRRFTIESANFMRDRIHGRKENNVQCARYRITARHVSPRQEFPDIKRDTPTEKSVINIFPRYET